MMEAKSVFFLLSVTSHKTVLGVFLCLPFLLPALVKAKEKEAAQKTETIVEADKITKGKNGEFSLKGNAVIAQGEKKIRAQYINYKQENGEVKVSGGVDYSDTDFRLKGSSASFNLQQETGVIFDAEYNLVHDPGKGSAQEVRLQSRTNAVLDDSNYTTCPVGKNDWRIVASQIELDTANGVGSSIHTRLEFYDIPLFYLPYYRFPIDDRRKTGFLLPRGGYSSEDGLDLRLPLYLNLAANFDATITSRVLSKRGMALETEFRYLLEQQEGEIRFDYLPDDELYHDDRYLIAFNQRGEITESITNRFDLAYVSDKDYFSDLGNSSSITGVDHLSNSIGYYYREGDWSGKVFLQAYQILNEDIAKQYQRLPRLDLAYNARSGKNEEWINRFNFEITNFEHPDNGQKPTGLRSDFYYKLIYDMTEPGWFIKPGVSLRQSNYDIDDNDNHSRTVYSASLDGGLFFERDMSLFGRKMLHTFEPRLYFLHTPYRDQQRLPVFDTTTNSLSFAQLFADDRFSGPDRIGDTTQVTAAVSSKIIDTSSARNLLSINMGEIFYLDNRLVTLGADQIQSRANSNFIASMRFAPYEKITFSSEVEWNHTKKLTQLKQLNLNYRQDDLNRIGISYLEQKNESAQVSVDSAAVNFSWEYNPKWRLVGKWNYSLLHEITQETFVGVEYDSGCWAIRLVSRRHIEELANPAEAEQQILFEIELLGVGGFGKKEIDEFMNP